jgi:cytochrome c biogenesis protein CcdA/thiol-disulfide isomerase/thioredoxin
MMKYLKRFTLASLLLTLLLVGSAGGVAADSPAPVYFFWGDGCPHCETQKPFLDELAARYPQVDVRSYEVWYVQENRQIFFDMTAKLGFEPSGVPVTIIGEQYWVGFHETIEADIEAAVVGCIQDGCPDLGVGTIPGLQPAPVNPAVPAEPVEPSPTLEPVEPVVEEEPAPPAGEEVLVLPLIGTINLGAHSLWFSTALIAFVDGFNPCSLWVLSILLALVIHSGSRKKILIVGLTFLLVTAAVYGLFIVGLFKVFTFVGFLGWIRAVVAVIALGFAAINIKDYFWFKEGVSLTVADKHKPKIYQDIRGLMAPDKSSLALIGATLVLALGIALVELPCTAGFPVLWTNLLAAQQVDTLTFALLLGLYMLIYLLDELIVFGTVVVTLKASKLEEKHGRVLKLVGGLVMLALAVVLLVNPDLMNSLTSSMLVFGVAFGLAGLVLLVHRVVLPRFGIYIGSELRATQKKSRPRRKKMSTG